MHGSHVAAHQLPHSVARGRVCDGYLGPINLHNVPLAYNGMQPLSNPTISSNLMVLDDLNCKDNGFSNKATSPHLPTVSQFNHVSVASTSEKKKGNGSFNLSSFFSPNLCQLSIRPNTREYSRS